MHTLRYTLYGLRPSYFTRKVEAALEMQGAPFDYVSKTMDNREEIEQRAGTHQMPVLRTPEGWVIADSSPIIDMLDGRFPQHRLYPEGLLGVLVHVVEEYFDEWIPRTAVHYRWQYEEDARFAAERMASETAPGADAQTREMIASAIAEWGGKSCRATGVQPESQQRAAEQELDRVLAALDAQLEHTAYALGDRPTAVDAVLLGGLRAHFLMDPEPHRRLQKHTRVVEWAEREHRPHASGELAPFPETTPFARAILEEMAGPYRRFVLGNATALAAGAKGFTAEVYGEQVSYKARAYPDLSRRLVGARVEDRLPREERARAREWLQRVRLSDVFLPDEGE